MRCSYLSPHSKNTHHIARVAHRTPWRSVGAMLRPQPPRTPGIHPCDTTPCWVHELIYIPLPLTGVSSTCHATRREVLPLGLRSYASQRHHKCGRVGGGHAERCEMDIPRERET